MERMQFLVENRKLGERFHMNVWEQGEGFPMVLLHGNGEDGQYFKHQMEFLKNHYRVIAVDTRGHGKSERGIAPFTIKQFADDLYHLLQEMNIKSIILLGFSDGGNVAIAFALKYQHMLKSMILNGANLTPAGVKRQVQLPIIAGYRIVSAIAALDKKQASIAKRELLGLMVIQPDFKPEMLQKITIPVLVLVGDRDMIKADHSRMIANSLTDGTLKVIRGNHFIASQSPNIFNQAVLEFLESQQFNFSWNTQK